MHPHLDPVPDQVRTLPICRILPLQAGFPQGKDSPPVALTALGALELGTTTPSLPVPAGLSRRMRLKTRGLPPLLYSPRMESVLPSGQVLNAASPPPQWHRLRLPLSPSLWLRSLDSLPRPQLLL